MGSTFAARRAGTQQASTANRGKAGVLPQHAQTVANVLKESPHELTRYHMLMRQERTAVHKPCFQSTCFQCRRLANPEDYRAGSNPAPQRRARYLPAAFRSGGVLISRCLWLRYRAVRPAPRPRSCAPPPAEKSSELGSMVQWMDVRC